jgi:hypothetical protein
MIIKTSLAMELERSEFLRDAVKAFKDSSEPSLSTYGNLQAGSLLAIRYGMMDRSILVVRLDAEYVPVLYTDILEGEEVE